MSSQPVLIPASAFTGRKNHLLRQYNACPVPPRKTPPSVPRTTGVQASTNVGSKKYSTISIPHLREAISTLDSKMASLMMQRRELEDNLEKAVRSQSPVLRLPSELLASIFIIGAFGLGEENPVMVSTLMLVCRSWSDVALDTPVLWSKITISQHYSLEKARRKLSRSRSCPLDITINFGAKMDFGSSVTEQVIHAMDLVGPALWRTRYFSLTVPNRPQAHAALARCQEDAPLLEELSITIHHSIPEDHYSSPPLPLFNGHHPRLHSCSLTSFNFGWDLRLMNRLRVLKLGGYYNGFTPSATTMISILRQCPELEELVLRNLSDVDSVSDNCHSPPSEDYFPAPVGSLLELPRLSRMSFYYAGIAIVRQVLSQIKFPSLEYLELCYMENVTGLLQLLQAQAVTELPLQILHIESSLFNELKFLNLLRRLPSLKVLELVDMEDASSSLLKGLASPQPWACPNLEELTLDGCTSLNWDSLRTFVESRLPANSYAYHNGTSSYSSYATSSASASAAANGQIRSQIKASQKAAQGVPRPKRLRSIDITRCNQISREMVQWLRMYVSEVKCEPAKNVWGGA